MTDKCTCSFRVKTVGDGCRHCNPQFWIGHLEDERDAISIENTALQLTVDKLREREAELLAMCEELTEHASEARKVLLWVAETADEDSAMKVLDVEMGLSKALTKYRAMAGKEE